MLFQVSFFGVPNTNKSYSAVSSETVRVGSSEYSILKFALLLYSVNNKSELFLIFSRLLLEVSLDKTCNKVNPTATVLSGAWMADYMGEREVRDAIFGATEQVINEGKAVTWDIGGNATTTQMTDAIIEYAKDRLKK